MQVAAKPKNELARLKALDSYSILDSLPEEDYDSLTRISAQICNTPISLVSLIEEKRQWHKSHYGTDICELEREFAFCTHAMLKPSEVMVIEDALLDDRFADNPVVASFPFVRFYAGVPLVDKEGHALGTLCVIDVKPNRLNQDQIDSLKALAKQVMNLLESRKDNILLKKTLKVLETKNLQLEEFNYIACHDLQEPLQTIRNFSTLLKAKHSAKLDIEANKYLNLIEAATDRMKELIVGLLDYSKDGSNLKKTSINTAYIIDEIKEDLNFNLIKNQASITVDKIPVISTHKTSFKQVLQNLISNALKFHSPNNNPVIKISAKSNKSNLEFCVADNGIGIKPEHQKSIFLIFSRLHNQNEFNGIGIGLAHCKKIVESLGGEIWVESEYGKGSQFYFSIPKS